MNRNEDLIAYLAKIATGSIVPWEPVKLVLVGQENVGKTSLLGRLKNTETDGISTNGVNTGNLILGLI